MGALKGLSFRRHSYDGFLCRKVQCETLTQSNLLIAAAKHVLVSAPYNSVLSKKGRANESRVENASTSTPRAFRERGGTKPGSGFRV